MGKYFIVPNKRAGWNFDQTLEIECRAKTRVFKSPSPTVIPGIGESPIPGDGESPPIKQILEKIFQN